MRAVVGRVVLALVFFFAGALFWTAGRLEQRVADGARRLATLDAGGPTADVDDTRTRAIAERLPWIADRLAEMRWQRAARQYFLSSGSAMMLQPSGDVPVADPRMRFLMANVEFHAARRTRGDRQALLRALDRVMKSYTDVLKRNPGDDDAAYNFELAARMRNALAKRPRTGTGPETIDEEKSNASQGSPPPHGTPGEAPPQAQTKPFNSIAPERPDERRERDAGKGGKPVRKG